MIKIENVEVVGVEHAIRGMRNPKNSWSRMDSFHCYDIDCDSCKERRDDSYEDCPWECAPKDMCYEELILGKNDRKLMMDLVAGGPVHAKYRRMIVVYVDITAPLYWWKEFDTYRIGVEKNSCSTMHKIHDKEFTLDDFSCEHLDTLTKDIYVQHIVPTLNLYRKLYNEADVKLKRKDLTEAERKHVMAQRKHFWWQMIQLLPSSYNQKRTVMLNYEVLVGMYKWRKNHKLDEWVELSKWIESLPYSEIITGGE